MYIYRCLVTFGLGLVILLSATATQAYAMHNFGFKINEGLTPIKFTSISAYSNESLGEVLENGTVLSIDVPYGAGVVYFGTATVATSNPKQYCILTINVGDYGSKPYAKVQSESCSTLQFKGINYIGGMWPITALFNIQILMANEK